MSAEYLQDHRRVSTRPPPSIHRPDRSTLRAKHRRRKVNKDKGICEKLIPARAAGSSGLLAHRHRCSQSSSPPPSGPETSSQARSFLSVPRSTSLSLKPSLAPPGPTLPTHSQFQYTWMSPVSWLASCVNAPGERSMWYPSQLGQRSTTVASTHLLPSVGRG